MFKLATRSLKLGINTKAILPVLQLNYRTEKKKKRISFRL